MAGGCIRYGSRSLLVYLYCQLLLMQLCYYNSKQEYSCQVFVNGGLDYNFSLEKSCCTKTKFDKIPLSTKMMKLLKLTDSVLLASALILIAGDINPNPGPMSTSANGLPKLNFKARGLSVVHLNIRSLRGKLDELRLITNNTKSADIITLSETWLTDDIDDNEVDLSGYTLVRKDRQDKIGGGVAIYVRDGLEYIERKDLHNPNEAIWIQINRTRCKPLVVGSLYRPPNSPIDVFLDNFNDSLSKIDPNHDKVILGDFNIEFSKARTINANQSEKRKLKGVTEIFDLLQLINSPTRVTKDSKSLIDLIFTNIKHKVVDSGVKDFGLSDHSMVYCILKSGLVKVPPKTIEYRNFKTYNKQSFIKDLNNVPWHVVFNEADDIESCVSAWNKLFLDVVDDHAPLRTRKVRGSPIPWITSKIATLMRDRDFHFKRAKGNKNNSHWAKYRSLRNKTTREIKKAKSEYYCNLINDARNNSADIWKSIKATLPNNKSSQNITSLVIDGESYNQSSSIASAFNNYFVNIGLRLADKITCLLPGSPIDNITKASSIFQFHPISIDFVIKAIKQLKPNKAIGLDKVSARLLKDAVEVVAPDITSLFNISIQTGNFPSIWKNARVTPLFKNKGSRQDPSNYRPVSVLPTLSKIFEKGIHDQLFAYLRDNHLLSNKQFGFRLKSSTVTAAAKFTDDILLAMDSGKITGAVFIDLTKAFDTVDHSILMSKLKCLGVPPNSGTYKWFQSYLSCRSQVTAFDNELSSKDNISIGVPQGSILGPLLFTIYINDLPEHLKHCDITLYADDTVLYISSNSICTIESELNSDLYNLDRWLTLNKLSLNIAKTKFMLLGSSHCLNKLDSVCVKVNDNTIDKVNNFTYLGIVINENLTWQDHIEYISGKINKKLGLLRRIRSCLPLEARILFFNSCILPMFDYADIIWGDRGNKVLMCQLQVLHNKAARIILDLPYLSSATESLKRLKWKSLDRRRAEHRLIFLYKCFNNLFSHRFNLDLNKDVHQYNTRNRNNIRKASAKTNWGLWTSTNFCSTLWNQLDSSIREINSLDKFKTKIRSVKLDL